MDYTQSYIIYGIGVVTVLAVGVYCLLAIFRSEKELHRKKKSSDKKDIEEYREFKRVNRREFIWLIVAILLTLFFYFIIGVWGVVVVIIIRVLAEIITNRITKGK